MQCLVIGCGRDTKVRGLCSSCYQLARLKVLQGKTTWKELEESDLAKRKQNQGGNGGPFNKAFIDKTGGR